MLDDMVLLNFDLRKSKNVTDYRGSHHLVTHHLFLDIVYLTTVVPSYYLRLTTSVSPSIFRYPYFPRVYI